MGFIGRSRELAELELQLQRVRKGGRADLGRAVLLRGRRRVGKSRLVTEFVARSGLPYVYFQAARHAPPARELVHLAEAVATSTLPDAALARDSTPTSLTAALTLLATALPQTPSIVVVDELPWLLEAIPGGAGELQRAWDLRLSHKPVLLMLLGSDLTMMEQLGAYDQPFHGRATDMVLEPMNPRDVARIAGLDAFGGFDAYLVTGGLPLVAREWDAGTGLAEYLDAAFSTSTSALIVAGSRVLDGEFPEETMARQVLTAIGGRGERTFTGIQNAARGEPLNASSLSTSLQVLAAKRVISGDVPLSIRPSVKDRRWRIADPGLRFWLAFVEPALAEIDRGRGDLASRRVQRAFPAWRGRAVEAVVRTALSRLLPDERWPDVGAVGGWWPRNNNPEVDLVGVDRASGTSRLAFAGSIKWRQGAPFSASEASTLARDAAAVPGAAPQTPLVAVCPAGADAVGLAETWTATDLLQAWE
jgi:uncharacterized protein